MLVLVQEINALRQTVKRLEQGRSPSPPHAPALQPPFSTLSITDIIGSSLAQQRSQSVASPSTPAHSPLVNNTNSVSSTTSDANNRADRGYGLEQLYHTLCLEAGDTAEDGASTSVTGQGALDPLLLEAEKVMTNPMFGMDAAGTSVPATPSVPAPQLMQAVALQQVLTSLLAHIVNTTACVVNTSHILFMIGLF